GSCRIGWAHGYPQDLVVAGPRAPAAVPVARRAPQRAVGRAHDGPQPAVLTGEMCHRRAQLTGVAQRDLPQPLAAKSRYPEAAARDRGSRRRRLARRPGEPGIGVPAVAGRALGDRPAVVAPLLDPVDLVETVLAELGGVHTPRAVPGHALHIAVPV